MAYMGRVVVAGNYSGMPFVGFVLASRSEPDRKLVPDEERKRVWVAPGEDVTAKLKKGDLTAVDNLYACLIGCYDASGRAAAVSFNGRMSNRAEAMVTAGYDTMDSMRKILEVFVPQPGDPRIGVVAHIDDAASPMEPVFCWGVHDRPASGDNHISVEYNPVRCGEALYVALASCRDTFELDLDTGCNLDGLSQQLFDKILGTKPEFGCGAAVCMLTPHNSFEFGIHNAK